LRVLWKQSLINPQYRRHSSAFICGVMYRVYTADLRKRLGGLPLELLVEFHWRCNLEEFNPGLIPI